MQPVVAKLEKQCSGNVTFIYADVDQRQYQQMASQYGVTAIPRYVLLDPSGKIMRQWLGATSQGDFEAAMGKICAGK